MKKNTPILKITLLLTSMMTMMSGAIVAPSLPQIKQVFIHIEHIEVLSRLIITLPALFIAAFAPIIGKIIDRLGRKKFLIASLVLYALGGTSGYFTQDIYLILAGRAVLGVAVGGIMTIATTLIGDYFKGEDRNAFVGMQGAFIGVGGIVFISIAGIFADIHWQMPFLIYLFSIPVLILAIIFLYEPDRSDMSQSQNEEKVDYDKKVVILIYLLAFTGIVFFYMIPVQIPFILESMNTSNAQMGYAISLSTFASAILSMNYRRIKKYVKFRNIFQLAMLFMGIGYLIVSQADSYYGILAGMFVSGMGTGLLMPTGNLWLMEIAPAAIRGQLIGRLSSTTFLGMFFSPILIQPVISYTGLANSFLVAAFLMWIIAGVLFLKKANY